MTDPLQSLRELPLPDLAPELTARIREKAHVRLKGGASSAPDRPIVTALAAAAVVLLCVSHLSWTVLFLTRLHEPEAVAGAVEPR